MTRKKAKRPFQKKSGSGQSLLPRVSYGLLFAIFLFSFGGHFLSIMQVPDWRKSYENKKAANRVKVKLVPKKKTLQKPKKILEAKQEKTEKPDAARYQGYQDHKTDKETKTKRMLSQKGQDPGQGGIAAKSQAERVKQNNPKSQNQKQKQKQNQKNQQKVVEKKKPKKKLLDSKDGSFAIKTKKNQKKKQKKTTYESLLPSNEDLKHQLTAGYQDYIDEALEESDKIDINTSDYRFIGYFTTMRKAIELVWNYPMAAARRGHQGVVGLEFTIFKNGVVKDLKIVQSSGYASLDQAIVEAIELNSPFSPLPEGFGKSKMTITGNFRYIL